MHLVSMVTAIMLSSMVACGQNAAPSAPADLPPLPPPSPTSIGLLRGHDQELGLTEEQLAALRELDEDLQARNLVLEREMAELLEPNMPKRGKRPPGKGPRGGGPQGGGMGGSGPPGGGMGGGPPSETEGEPPPVDREPPRMTTEQRDKADRIREEMMENERSFLARALELLDADQRAKADEILEGNTRRPSGPPHSFEDGPPPSGGGPQ